jgi:glutathione S-transferase
MLRIYGQPNSINVRKVLWACEEIGIPFEREDWGGTTRSTAEPAFKALNPFSLVPVIDDDGVILRESNAIVRYLATSRGRTDLAPGDPARRAAIEAWMDWQGADVSSACRYVFMGLLRARAECQDPAQLEASDQAYTKLMTLADHELASSGGYIAGPAFTMADICVGLSVRRWLAIPRPRADLPNLMRYYDLLNERPGFQKYGSGFAS